MSNKNWRRRYKTKEEFIINNPSVYLDNKTFIDNYYKENTSMLQTPLSSMEEFDIIMTFKDIETLKKIYPKLYERNKDFVHAYFETRLSIVDEEAKLIII